MSQWFCKCIPYFDLHCLFNLELCPCPAEKAVLLGCYCCNVSLLFGQQILYGIQRLHISFCWMKLLETVEYHNQIVYFGSQHADVSTRFHQVAERNSSLKDFIVVIIFHSSPVGGRNVPLRLVCRNSRRMFPPPTELECEVLDGNCTLLNSFLTIDWIFHNLWDILPHHWWNFQAFHVLAIIW